MILKKITWPFVPVFLLRILGKYLSVYDGSQIPCEKCPFINEISSLENCLDYIFHLQLVCNQCPPQIKMRISLSSSLSQTTCFCDMTWQNPLYRHIPKTRRFKEGWTRWWEREGEVLQQRVPPPLRDGDRSVIREPLTHTSHPAARWEAAVLSCLMQPLPSTLGV